MTVCSQAVTLCLGSWAFKRVTIALRIEVQFKGRMHGQDHVQTRHLTVGI